MSRIPPALEEVYAARPIAPGDLPAVVKAVGLRPTRPDELTRAYAELYAGDFEERAQRLLLLQQDRDVLRLADRRHEAGEIESFRFAGRRYDSADARRLLQRVTGRLDEEERWWADFDRRAFVLHYRMARDLSGDAAHDLRSRYDFQLALQDIDRETSRRRRILARVASFVDDTDGPLEYADFHDVRTELLEAYDAFEKCLRIACHVRPPPLDCLPKGQPLANVLLTRTPVPRLRPAAQTVSGRWINKFARQLDEVRTNARKVQAESLAALLEQQAWVARQWEEETASLPEVEAADEPTETEEERAAREAAVLQPLDGQEEYDLSEEDVLTDTGEEIPKPDAELDEEPDPEEFVLSEHDVLAEPEEAGSGVEMEDIDPEDHTGRPRHWGV